MQGGELEYLVYPVILFSILMGIVFHIKILWFARVYTAGIMAILIGIGTGLLVVSDFQIISIVLICIIQAYRLFSYLRVAKNRIQKEALRLRSRKTEIVLSLFTIIILIFEAFFPQPSSYTYILILSILQFIFSVIFLQKIHGASHDTNVPFFSKHIPDLDLPSITVAIPARNETSDLTDCLQNILKSNYPKMEIVVLDDCSQDATSDIIRSFAHKGIRFLEGTIPKGSWMAKNYAYQQLLDESEGKLVLFCGVDVRLEPDSIRKLVEVFIKTNQRMISVLPTRNGLHDYHQIIQPMRYWRELAIPKIFSKHPPALGTFWLIDRKYLNRIGGFSAYKQSIKPEKHFAKKAKTTKQYTFLRSSAGLGIASIKTYTKQWDTAVRTRYPEHKKQPENVFMFSIWFFAIFALPLTIGVFALALGYIIPAIFSIFSSAILLYVHSKVDSLTNGKRQISNIILFPLTVISEIVLINYSMWAYEFSEVIWKGRNICLPVLRIVPKLPKY